MPLLPGSTTCLALDLALGTWHLALGRDRGRLLICTLGTLLIIPSYSVPTWYFLLTVHSAIVSYRSYVGEALWFLERLAKS